MAATELSVLPWWDLVFGAGFPDWLITSPLPPSAPGERWAFTGRTLVPLPAALYDFWWAAHCVPVRLRDLWQAAAPFIGRTTDRAALDRVFFESGLFVTWPWGLTTASDTPEAIGLRRNLAIQPAPPNPLPQIIPDQAWADDTLSMVQLTAWWAAAREAAQFPGGLFRTVQDLVQRRAAWFVARPLP